MDHADAVEWVMENRFRTAFWEDEEGILMGRASNKDIEVLVRGGRGMLTPELYVVLIEKTKSKLEERAMNITPYYGAPVEYPTEPESRSLSDKEYVQKIAEDSLQSLLRSGKVSQSIEDLHTLTSKVFLIGDFMLKERNKRR